MPLNLAIVQVGSEESRHHQVLRTELVSKDDLQASFDREMGRDDEPRKVLGVVLCEGVVGDTLGNLCSSLLFEEEFEALLGKVVNMVK